MQHWPLGSAAVFRGHNELCYIPTSEMGQPQGPSNYTKQQKPEPGCQLSNPLLHLSLWAKETDTKAEPSVVLSLLKFYHPTSVRPSVRPSIHPSIHPSYPGTTWQKTGSPERASQISAVWDKLQLQPPSSLLFLPFKKNTKSTLHIPPTK